MKIVKIVAAIASVALVGVGGAMAISNPNEEAYNEYAVTRLSEYLQNDVCAKAPSTFGNILRDQCSSFVESNQSEIAELVANSTERQNFIVFSLYKTELSLKRYLPFLPSYQFETVGALNDFYTYKAQKQ